jgi:hypothetical protein
MKIFRIQLIRKLTAVCTGLIFLNMSFFMAEVNALELEKKNIHLLENLVRLIAGIGYEEEKDIFGDSSSSESLSKEIDLFINPHPFSSSRLEIDISASHADDILSKPISGNYETFTPPPEA